jgi:hypothetical protein
LGRAWNFVGAKTRKISRQDWLATWRNHLAKCFPVIETFHEQVRAAFWRASGGGGAFSGYRAFETNAHRAFIDQTIGELLQCASCVVALAIEETLPHALVARFSDSMLLARQKDSPSDRFEMLRTSISDKLAVAFDGSTFYVQIEEVRA